MFMLYQRGLADIAWVKEVSLFHHMNEVGMAIARTRAQVNLTWCDYRVAQDFRCEPLYLYKSLTCDKKRGAKPWRDTTFKHHPNEYTEPYASGIHTPQEYSSQISCSLVRNNAATLPAYNSPVSSVIFPQTIYKILFSVWEVYCKRTGCVPGLRGFRKDLWFGR